jgi:hypothetical protein
VKGGAPIREKEVGILDSVSQFPQKKSQDLEIARKSPTLVLC